MIRFGCPTCKGVITSDAPGSKFPCPHCGQRVQVPQPPPPPPQKTVLGDLLPDPSKTVLGNLEEVAPPPVQIAASVQPPVAPIISAQGAMFGYLARKNAPHSGMGIASFIIAFLVGGLDLILLLITVLNIAKSGNRNAAQANFVGGALAMVCLNFGSIPLCLIGLGLGGTALFVQKDRNHLLTVIGVFVNALVILGVLGLFVLGSVVSD